MRKRFIGAVGGVLLVPTLACFNVIPPFMGWLALVSLLYLLLPLAVTKRESKRENDFDEMLVSAISPWSCEWVSILFSAVILIHGIVFSDARVPSVMNLSVNDMQHVAPKLKMLALCSTLIVDYVVVIICGLAAVFIDEYVVNRSASSSE